MKRRTVNETTKQWMIYLQDVKYQLDNFKIGVILGISVLAYYLKTNGLLNKIF